MLPLYLYQQMVGIKFGLFKKKNHLEFKRAHVTLINNDFFLNSTFHLTIRPRTRVFYDQFVNSAAPRCLSLVENEGESSNCFSTNLLVVSLHKNVK